MPEYGFSLVYARIRSESTILIQEYYGQRKPVFCHILRSADCAEMPS